MKFKKVIRNIPTKELLLLLAQANAIGCQFVDLSFDMEKRSVGITPISREEVMHRFEGGKEGTNMEDLISDET